MNSTTIIIGLGETGLSCVDYYVTRDIPVTVLDSRESPPHLDTFKKRYPTVPIYTGSFPKHVLASAKTIVLSPGISQYHPDIQQAVSPETEIIGDIELFARNVSAPVVAITGSNGKSTVTTLVGEMAKAAGIKVGVGGNLGRAALTLLAEKPDLYVLELSSFQLETTYSLKPIVSTVLNISPDHLDRYQTVDEYRLAKYRIFKQSQSIVYDRKEPHLPETKPVKTISFGLDAPLLEETQIQYGIIKHNEEYWLARNGERLLPVSRLKLSGQHNVLNALAALALGDSIQLPLEAMLRVLENFKGLAHRAEWVRLHNDVLWINDSKGTNVGATLATLEGLSTTIPGKWVLIAGGVGKNADFSPLVSLVERHCRAVVLIGESAKNLYDLFHTKVPCTYAKSLEEAVLKAKIEAKPKDGVLLSPICASYDMFQNFEERGNVFKKAVQMLE